MNGEAGQSGQCTVGTKTGAMLLLVHICPSMEDELLVDSHRLTKVTRYRHADMDHGKLTEMRFGSILNPNHYHVMIVVPDHKFVS